MPGEHAEEVKDVSDLHRLGRLVQEDPGTDPIYKAEVMEKAEKRFILFLTNCKLAKMVIILNSIPEWRSKPDLIEARKVHAR